MSVINELDAKIASLETALASLRSVRAMFSENGSPAEDVPSSGYVIPLVDGMARWEKVQEAIRHLGPQTITELATRLGMTAGNVYNTINTNKKKFRRVDNKWCNK